MSLVEQCKNLTPYNPFRNIIIVGRNSKNPEKRDSMKKKKKKQNTFTSYKTCVLKHWLVGSGLWTWCKKRKGAGWWWENLIKYRPPGLCLHRSMQVFTWETREQRKSLKREASWRGGGHWRGKRRGDSWERKKGGRERHERVYLFIYDFSPDLVRLDHSTYSFFITIELGSLFHWTLRIT